MRSKVLLAIAAATLPAWATAAELSVRFQTSLAVEGSPGDGAVTLHLLPQSPSDTSKSFSIPVPGDFVVELPAGTTWQILTESPSLWSAPQWIAVNPGVEPLVSLRHFPAAKLTGSLKAPQEEMPDGHLDLRVEASPGAEFPKPPATPLQCPIEEMRFRCHVPAGRFDLRLRAGRHVPVYLWDVEVQAGRAADLGVLPLKQGASVVGWVRTEDGKGADGALVRLEPQVLGLPSDPGMVAALKSSFLETYSNKRGFFQFEDVAAGTFVVTASRSGLITSQRPDIEVRPKLEAQILDPLVLTKPLTVRFHLDPPSAPSGEPWKLVLNRKSELEGLRGETFRGASGAEGTWEQAGLTTGTYSLWLEDGGARWMFEDLAVSPEQTDLQVVVPGVRLRGRVTLGEEPLQATLWFGGRSAPRRARFVSNEKGQFEGLLPEEGTWPVELTAELEGLQLKLDPVEVRKLPGKSHAQIDVRVPDTRLRGRVIDERGRPVRRASILLQPGRKLASSAETDAEGTFEVKGLPAGALFVHAEEGDRESEWLQAYLEEGRNDPELQLVLRPRRVIHGRVFSSRGPVPGAQITAMAEIGPSGAGSGDHTASGASGEFTLKMPAATRMLNLTVLAPGHATRMMLLPLGDPPLVEIALDPVGGTLVFDFGSRTLQEVLRTRAGLLAHAGAFVPFGATARWAQALRTRQSDPHRLVLPNMEPGDYLLCVGAEAQEAVPRGLEPPPAECARGYLPPLGELTLRLPEIPSSYLDAPKAIR